MSCRQYILHLCQFLAHIHISVQSLKDWMLIVAVLLMIAVDLIILVVYVLVATFSNELRAKRIPHKEHPTDIEGVSDDKF